MPDDLLRDAVAPNCASPAHAPKQPPVPNRGGSCPLVYRRLHPIGNRDGSNVAALADQIDQRPVLFPLLDVSDLELGDLRPAQAAAQEQGQDRPITPAPYRLRLWRLATT